MLAVQLSKNHKLVRFIKMKNAVNNDLWRFVLFFFDSKPIAVRIPQDVIQRSGNQRRCETHSNLHKESHVQYCSWSTWNLYTSGNRLHIFIIRKSQCNRKVLLRERKRHTARRVASLGGGGGTPTWPRGYLPQLGVPTLAGVTYLSWGRGTYLGQGAHTLAGGYLHQGGTHLGWDGVPPGCEQTDACENSTFPHPSDAGGNNLLNNLKQNPNCHTTTIVVSSCECLKPADFTKDLWFQNIHMYSVHNSERLRVEREGFDEITQSTNKGWSLNCETVEVIFPYEFNFAACFEEASTVVWNLFPV